MKVTLGPSPEKTTVYYFTAHKEIKIKKPYMVDTAFN